MVTAIELPEFNLAQVQTLCQKHQLFYNQAQIEQLMAIVGGHPYLIRVAFYKIARHHLTLDQFLTTAASETGPYADHLRRQLVHLQKNQELATIFKTVVTTDNPIQIRELGTADFKLKALGLIKIDDNNNTVIPQCELYRQYFKNRL